MRVSSLSDERIIDLVSRYFVPVWISRDHYQLAPPPKAEQDLLARIDADRRRKQLEGGTVCVYIVAADGEALATMTVHRACKPDQLAPFLRKIVADRKLTARAAAVRAAAAAPAPPPRPAADSRLFTIRTRFDDAGPNRGATRDRIELTKAEWQAFVPPVNAATGDGWSVARPAAEKLLRHAYPPVSHWDARLAKLRSCNLSARVLSVRGGDALMRLEGKLDLVYPDQGKPDDGRATARLIGYVHCDVRTGRLTSLHLVSEEGKYVWSWKGTPQPRATSLAIELEP